jgi:hypothetical protein
VKVDAQNALMRLRGRFVFVIWPGHWAVKEHDDTSEANATAKGFADEDMPAEKLRAAGFILYEVAGT